MTKNPLIKHARRIVRTSAVLAAGLALAPAGNAAGTDVHGGVSAADDILLNGRVYTEDPSQPWAQAIAVSGGRIVAVGSNGRIRALRAANTRITDLQGRMVMPGLIDDHVHAAEGAFGELYDCLFESTSTPDQIKAALAECVKKAPPGTWIKGGYWDSNFFKHFAIASPRAWLDAVTGDRPLIWRDDTGHNVWANSAALKAAHVDSQTPDPAGGRFEREAGGKIPNGVAFEAAAELLSKAIPPRTSAEYQNAVAHVQEVAHRFGIIGIKEADAREPEMAAYTTADTAGKLKLYVASCINTLDAQDTPEKIVDFDAIDRIHATYHSAHVATDFVKIFLDGVPTPARTAAMIDPYVADSSGARVRGDFHISPDVLIKDVVELDRRGYTIKMHAAGDRSIREGLDAVEAARRANPAGTLRHELAHAGFIAPEDMPRFAKLNVTADLSPVIWYPSPIIDAVIEAVGERGRHYWPMRSFIELGTPMAAGSDWPSVVPSMDPWGGIQAMITRSDPYKPSTQKLWPEQGISLAEALRIYTLGGASGLKREADTGSIVKGKSADFIVLDRDLFKVPATEISRTKVLKTYFEGKLVYEQKPEKKT